MQWIGVLVLAFLAMAMTVAAVSTVGDFDTVPAEQAVLEHDPKVRQMLAEAEHRRQIDEYKLEVQYISAAAIELAAAAFLAGRALGGRE